LLSGIGLALFAARLARADDANGFLVIFQSPRSIDDEKDSTRDRAPQPLGATLRKRMAEIFPIQAFGIAEDGGGFFKGNAVLLQICQRFPGVPGEHINVYTLIRGGCK